MRISFRPSPEKHYSMNKILLAFTFFSIAISSCKKDNPKVEPPAPLTNLTSISYGSGPDYLGQANPAYHTLDIYFPPNATTDKKYPLFFYIHGGGFLVGDKAGPDATNICGDFARNGYVAVSINYRLGYPNSGNPGDCTASTSEQQKAIYRAVQDANAAMRFIVSKAKEYAVDTSKIFLGGASAGGITILNMNYYTQAYCNSKFPGIDVQMGGLHNSINPITQSYTFKGISNGWGVISDSTLINASKALPTINFHGTNDPVTPYNNGYFLSCPNYSTAYGSLNIHRQLTRLGKPVKTHLLLNAGHGPDEYKFPFYSQESICFFNRVINGLSINSAIYYGMATGCD